MATEKQIAANRANAKRSTGPKTVGGKMVSSRNSYRHGLSCPLPVDPVMLEQADAIAVALVGNEASPEQLTCAEQFALAHLELLRIRLARTDMLLKLELGNTRELLRLAALDRYERYSLTRRRRSANKLQRDGGGEG
jgi:hypothetical protein